ncbi:MAG: pyridoxamine 5'-phosphate oxidase family protein [Gemmatimonadota bacterium]
MAGSEQAGEPEPERAGGADQARAGELDQAQSLLPEIEEMRRRDRAKDPAWIRAFLRQAPFGVLATVADGAPFLNSNLFLFDESEGKDRIYLHTARVGRTPQQADAGGPATFSAAVMGRFLPAAEALEFSVEYSAVVVFGTLTPVPHTAEKRRVLAGIMAKYAPHLEPGKDYRAITAAELKRTAVHRLDIQRWSGKEKVVAPDFPGAYVLPVPTPPFQSVP